MTFSVSLTAKECDFVSRVRVSGVLGRFGIDTRLQLAISVCVIALIIVTTLGGSGGAPWVFVTYRTLLVAIAILGVMGSRDQAFTVSSQFLTGIGAFFALALISVLQITGSHFEAFYLWYKYAFFAAAFIGLALFARSQPARWRATFFAAIIGVQLAHLVPELVRRRAVVVGFSSNNANYFATFLLIGLAVSIASAVFTDSPRWRVAAAISGVVLLFGIVKTASRGATLAMIAMIAVAAIRARGRVPRQAWMITGLVILLVAIVTSPYLIQKFFDRNQIDPYNYARTEIWKSSLEMIRDHPLFGVGFAQFYHVSKRYTRPMQGAVARYMKRASMAHNEYLQHIGELGLPAALLLFVLLGCCVYLAGTRAPADEGSALSSLPDTRCFHEAALFAAIGVGLHALVDNCWTIPVTASGLVVLALADPLPLTKVETRFAWNNLRLATMTVAMIALYAISIAIPGLGLYYNDVGHKAYDRDDFATAERYHLKAVELIPNHPTFLDNLGMVYLQQFSERKNFSLLPPAREYFRRAIEANPRSLDPHIHLETVLIRQLTGEAAKDAPQYREMIRTDKELLPIDPFIPFSRKNLAGAYYNTGEYEEALLEVRKAIEYEPNYVPGYLQLSTWYKERGDQIAGDRHMAVAVSIIRKYRDFKPTEPYEGILLGRPEESWIALASPKQ